MLCSYSSNSLRAAVVADFDKTMQQELDSDEEVDEEEEESDVTIVVHGDTVVGSKLHVILTVDGEEAAPDDEEDVRWYRMVADEWQEFAGGMSYTVSQEDAGCALRAAYYEVECITAQIAAAPEPSAPKPSVSDIYLARRERDGVIMFRCKGSFENCTDKGSQFQWQWLDCISSVVSNVEVIAAGWLRFSYVALGSCVVCCVLNCGGYRAPRG